jgi:hypothetical protein
VVSPFLEKGEKSRLRYDKVREYSSRILEEGEGGEYESVRAKKSLFTCLLLLFEGGNGASHRRPLCSYRQLV